MLVELADPPVDGARVELRAGQLVQRGDDADVGRVSVVGAAEHLGQRPHVVRADVAGTGLQRHDEGQVLGSYPLGQQAHLGVAEQPRRQQPVRQHRRAGHRRGRHPSTPSGGGEAHCGADQRSQRHLLRAQAEGADHRPRRRPHDDRSDTGESAGRPPQRSHQRRGRRDALPQRRDLARALTRPSDRLRNAQPDRTRHRADDRWLGAPVTEQRGAGQATDDACGTDLPEPAGCRPLSIRCHRGNLTSDNHGRDRPTDASLSPSLFAFRQSPGGRLMRIG